MNADLPTFRRLRRSRRMLAAALAASAAAIPFPAALLTASVAQAQEITAGSLTISPAQLQSVVVQGFPREEELLGGLAKLTLSDPVIAIPLQGDRIQLDLAYQLDVSVDGRSEQGALRVASGLRYHPASRGLHLQNPEVLEIRDANQNPAVDNDTRALITALLQDYAKNEPIYRLDQETLAQVPGNLGADAIRIEGGQVHLNLSP